MKRFGIFMLGAISCVMIYLGLCTETQGMTGINQPNPLKANAEQFERVKPYLYAKEFEGPALAY